MIAPTANITIANRNSSFCPSNALPAVEPTSAPTTPAAAYTCAQRHFTVLLRA
jgi:hypothetical protein